MINPKPHFINLFKKMNKKADRLTARQIEDIGLIAAMKQSENSGEGKLSNVLKHLDSMIASSI